MFAASKLAKLKPNTCEFAIKLWETHGPTLLKIQRAIFSSQKKAHTCVSFSVSQNPEVADVLDYFKLLGYAVIQHSGNVVTLSWKHPQTEYVE